MVTEPDQTSGRLGALTTRRVSKFRVGLGLPGLVAAAVLAVSRLRRPPRLPGTPHGEDADHQADRDDQEPATCHQRRGHPLVTLGRLVGAVGDLAGQEEADQYDEDAYPGHHESAELETAAGRLVVDLA